MQPLTVTSGRLLRLNYNFVGAFAKFRKSNVSFVVSVRPHEITQVPMGKF